MGSKYIAKLPVGYENINSCCFYRATKAAVSQNSCKGQAKIMHCVRLRLAKPEEKKWGEKINPKYCTTTEDKK